MPTCTACPQLEFGTVSALDLHRRILHQEAVMLPLASGESVQCRRDASGRFACPKCTCFASKNPAHLSRHARKCMQAHVCPARAADWMGSAGGQDAEHAPPAAVVPPAPVALPVPPGLAPVPGLAAHGILYNAGERLLFCCQCPAYLLPGTALVHIQRIHHAGPVATLRSLVDTSTAGLVLVQSVAHLGHLLQPGSNALQPLPGLPVRQGLRCTLCMAMPFLTTSSKEVTRHIRREHGPDAATDRRAPAQFQTPFLWTPALTRRHVWVEGPVDGPVEEPLVEDTADLGLWMADLGACTGLASEGAP
jgi:hypothetical protein